jgi:hypothetical protein
MNCHGNNDRNSGEGKRGHKGHGMHMLLMALCCALPILLIWILPALNISSKTLSGILPFAAVLLCPLMHIMMIPAMMHKDKGANSQEGNPKNQIED